MAPHRQVLFICTGNYYRSRYAEALFNFEAERRGLGWRAFSRGLAIHQAFGDISSDTLRAMRAAGIPPHYTGPTRISLTESDLFHADQTIALKETEHRPMMAEQFPDWKDRIEYWAVHDQDVWLPEQALPEIEKRVAALVDTVEAESLASQRASS